MRIDKRFSDWFEEVNEDIRRFTGMSIEYVDEKKLHEWYNEGYSPWQAAETALMNEGFHIDENHYFSYIY